MIYKFPRFKILTLKDQSIVEKYTEDFLPYSDFTFASLWLWTFNNSTHISELNGNLVIRFNDYVTKEPFYTYIGKKEIINTTDTLFKNIQSNADKSIKLIPEEIISELAITEKYNIEEDRDNFDYIYSIKELVAFAGRKFRSKKNFVNRFLKLYKPSHSVIDLNNPEGKKKVMELCTRWRKSRNKNYSEVHNEWLAIKRAIKWSNNFNLICIGVFVKDKMVGFTINEVLHDGYAMNLFEKGDIKYTGIFPYLRSITALELEKVGCKYLNHEQDLGIDGLRASKLSFNPEFFLKKYTISHKQ